MATFKISPATSFSFRIETGAGTINSGATLFNNYLHEDVIAYFNGSDAKNCRCVINWGYAQKYLSGTTADFQFQYDNSTVNPRVIVKDPDGAVAAILALKASSGTYRDYELSFDVAGGVYELGKCYKIYIYSDDLTQNLFTQGDSGTHETGAGITGLYTGEGVTLNNTLSKSAAQAQNGAFSALVQAPGTPANDHRFIYSNDASSQITLEAGKVYQAVAHVYVPSSNSWVPGNSINLLANFDGAFGDQVGTTPGWTDATILTQGTADASNTDTWQEIITVFQVGAVTDGSLVITSDNIPNVNGEIYVDSVEISPLSEVLEATSEPFIVMNELPCYQKFTWTNSNDAHQINYATGIVNTVYLQANYHKFHWLDPEFFSSQDQNNKTILSTSASAAATPVEFSPLPFHMLQKIALGVKHGVFKINDVEYSVIQSNIRPEWDGEKILAPVEILMRPTEYDYQNSLCD